MYSPLEFLLDHSYPIHSVREAIIPVVSTKAEPIGIVKSIAGGACLLPAVDRTNPIGERNRSWAAKACRRNHRAG